MSIYYKSIEGSKKRIIKPKNSFCCAVFDWSKIADFSTITRIATEAKREIPRL